GKYPVWTERIKLLGAMTKYRSCFDVHYYNLDVQIDPAKKFVGGTVLIAASAVNDFDTLQIDLYPNMNLKSVSCDLGNVKYFRKEGAIFISMPRRMKTGESFSLTVSYDGSPIVARKPPWDGGFVWKKDANGNAWCGVACETEGASLWWPCKDHNSDEADSVDISVTCPSGLMAVCNGLLRDSSDAGKGWKKFHWHVSYNINNYNVTFYIGNLKLLHDTFTSITGKIIELNHYVLPENYEKAKTQFDEVKKILAFYEKTFGAYPWQRDGFKLVNSPFEGMEHQTAIAYGSNFKDSWMGVDYIILHETAHEWWGNAITAKDFSDVWLQEGFATYSESLYLEQEKDKTFYNNYLYFYRLQNLNERPIVGPVGVRYFDYHDEDVYTKGAGTLQTLRATINNDSVFFDIIKTYFSRYEYHQITSEEFISVVNEKTGSDYHWLFNQYLHDRRIPVLEFYWDQGGQFAYHWVDCVDGFKMPIVIDCGDEKQTLYPTTSYQHDRICPVSGAKQFSFDRTAKLYKLRAKSSK
ncbi:MAG TPA: peptidase M1, partial [Bacteroidetes bacterium]|nr:peptidase M1 [Bacteroidota bacterium]